MVKVVKDMNVLRQKSEDVSSVDEAKSLIKDLEDALKQLSNGVGLAAIQLGHAKKVGVIKKANGEFLHLINPQLIEFENEFIYFNEGCLSFPGVFRSTKRYHDIVVKHQIIEDDKFKEQTFVAHHCSESCKCGNDDNLVVIAIQHEIEHFSGNLIFDHDIKGEQIIKEVKVGRNDPCPCKSGKKFKKCCINK